MTDLADYRRRARAWLAANAPPAADEEPADAVATGQLPVEEARAFMARMYDAGYSGISWPGEYGGQGLTAAEDRAFREEARGYRLPISIFGIGLGMCGPTLLSLGTEEHKRRYIRPLLRGEEIWCQMFSEPGAGSDVASLQTRAVREEGGWSVSGQKVWTTGAQLCDYGIVIARTDPDVPKHKGITMFIVDMHAPGVTVRPLRDMTGRAHFNEVFFDQVRVPHDHVVGEVGQGWRAAITMLLHERVSIGTGAAVTGAAAAFGPLLAAARRDGLTGDPLVRDQLVELYVRERGLDLLNTRMAQEVRAGIDPGARGSVVKLLLAELTLYGADLATSLAGAGAVAYDPDLPGADRLADALSFAPGMALGGGTNEIVRNTIGDYVLGLPKEPQVDRDVPFRELKVGTQKGAGR